MTSEGVSFNDYVFKIIILSDSGEELLDPVYPYVLSKEDVMYLKEFLEDYRELLIEHYMSGSRLYFSRFLYGFDTDLKERFKERWWKKGVMID